MTKPTDGTKIIGGVLIGGQSRRMGTCKALLQMKGRTFVETIVKAVKAVTDEVVLLGHIDPVPASLHSTLMLGDEPGVGGPLAGLSSLLKHANGRWALLIACDMPLVQPRLLERLIKSRTDDVDAVVFRVVAEHRDHYPCCAVFHPNVLADVHAQLHQTGSLRGLIERIRCRKICPVPGDVPCLRNINTPQDYQLLPLG